MSRFAFPIRLETQRNGWILASYPDVPEALTEGETEQEALDEAQDCLIGALGGYIARGWPIPMPSFVETGAIAELPEEINLKLSLYTEMLQQNMSAAMLAKRIGKSSSWVTQLLDLDQSTSPGQVAKAMGILRETASGSSCARDVVVGDAGIEPATPAV